MAALTQRFRAHPWTGGASEPLRGRFAWGVVVPIALVGSLAVVAGEHAQQFLFVPMLGVAAVAVIAGAGPAVLASAISLVAGAFFLFEPAHSFLITSGFDALRLGGAGVVSVVMALTIGALRASYHRASRQQLALERAVRLRDEVLAVVSHDLKAPLGAMRLSAGALTRLAAAAPEVGRHAGRILSSTEQMERLIHDLLDAASIDAGRLSIQRARHVPEEVAREALEHVHGAAEAAGVRLSLSVEPGAPAQLSCDRQRVLQCLGNLLGNAVNATADGGHVALELRAEGEAVVFGVRDTGTGIDPDELPHLFDRFRRGRGARHRGSGLGLAIAKGIAEAHGGLLRAESRPGEGSLFELVLPVEEAA